MVHLEIWFIWNGYMATGTMLKDACCCRTTEQKEVCGERNKSEPDSVYENVRGAAL